MNETRKSIRSGSFMSDRQIGRAAAEGQRLIFITLVGPVSGYVVGADDFSWLVATVASTVDRPGVVLVHKSCPIVEFEGIFLDAETEEDQKTVRDLGTAFWNHCKTKYLGKTVTTSQEQP